MSTETKPMTPGYNRTPYKQVRCVMSGEIVNEFGNIICNCDIDVNPHAINVGNAAFLQMVLNSHPELLAALEGLLLRYVGLVNFGDCGNWDPETEEPVIAARAAIAKAGGQV